MLGTLRPLGPGDHIEQATILAEERSERAADRLRLKLAMIDHARAAGALLSSPLGKIHRVMDDGRIPPDNPFANRADVLGSI